MRAVLAKRGRQSVIFGRVDTGTAAAGVATAGAAAAGAAAAGAAAGGAAAGGAAATRHVTPRHAKARKSGGDMRRAKAAERRVTEAAERRAADRNPTRAATSFGDQLADLVDESRRKSVMQAGEDLPPAAEEMRAGGVKAREERTRLKEARRRREAGLPPLTEEEAVAEAMQAGEGLLGWQYAAERRARSLS